GLMYVPKPFFAGRLPGRPIGTRVMLSTPAAITMSWVPDITACAAKCSACCEEPHCRSTEVAGTDSGSFEASTALRAMLVDCSPAWPTQPMITSSIRAGSAPLRSTSALSTWAARSAGCQPDSRPPFLPPAVRAAATMNASAMVFSWNCSMGGSAAGGDDAAVDDDRLARYERARRAGEHHGHARDVLGLTEPAQRIRGLGGGAPLRVLVEGAGEVGLDQPRGDAVDPDVLGAPFAAQVARELHVGRLRDAVQPDLARAAQATDRGDDDDRAAAGRLHVRAHHLAQPVIAQHVVAHDLVEDLVAHALARTEVGIRGGVADEDVDRAQLLAGPVDHRLQVLLARDVR